MFNIQTGQDGQFYAEGLQAANQNQENAQQMYSDSLQQAVAAAGQHPGSIIIRKGTIWRNIQNREGKFNFSLLNRVLFH